MIVRFLYYLFRNNTCHISRSPHGRRTAAARPSSVCRGITTRYPYDSTDIARASCGNRTMAVRVNNKSTISVRFFFWATNWTKILRLLHGHRAASVGCPCGDRAMPVRYVYGLRFVYGLTIFISMYNFLLYKIVEATAPVNPYDIVRLWPPPYGGRTIMELRAVYGLRRHIVGQM